MALLWGFLSMLGWGIADFLAAKASRKIGFVLTFLWVEIVAFVILLIYFLMNFSSFDIVQSQKFLFVLLVAGLLGIVGTLAFFKGLKEGQVSLVSPLGASYVLIVVILSVVFFRETLQLNQVIAIILIISGIIMTSVNLKEFLGFRKTSAFIGVVKEINLFSTLHYIRVKEGIVAMLAWGFAFFLIVPAVRFLGWFLPLFITTLFVILFLVLFIIVGKRWTDINRQFFRESFQFPIIAILLFSGFLNILAYVGYNIGIIKGYVPIIAPIAASYPLITVILAKIFLKEKLVLNQIIGILGTITGLILISM